MAYTDGEPMYTTQGYQDNLSALMGQMAPSAAQFNQAGSTVQKNLIQRQFDRDSALRSLTRARGDIGRQAAAAYRQLPGAFNRRGMLDSGAYVRRGRETAADVLRAQNRLREDYGESMMRSYLQDQLDLGNLSELRQNLASRDYQDLVAGLYGDRMRGA